MHVRTTLLLSVFMLACQPIRQIGDTEFTDQQRERRFKRTPAKLAVLRRAANDRLPLKYQGPELLKRYDYWPQIVDHKFRGLWHIDNYSHRGPLLVINGKRIVTVVPIMEDKVDGLDSLHTALRRYPVSEISLQVRDRIIKHFEFIYR